MKRYKEANDAIHAPAEIKERAAQAIPGPKRARWIAATAAVVAACLLCICIIPQMNLNTAGSGARETGGLRVLNSKHALAEATYPAMSPYANEADYINENSGDGDYDAYLKALENWRTDLDSMRSGTQYKDLIGPFVTNATKTFFADADEKNRVFSPLNVYLATAMLAETTDRETRQQILDVLGVDSIETLRERARTLWNDIYLDDDNQVTLLANSLWLRDDTRYKQQTVDTLAQDYYASSFAGHMGNEEYNQTFREWINQQTNSLLEDSVEQLKLDAQTVMALVSTMYLKAPWADQFSESATTEGTFHAPTGDVPADFMHTSMFDLYCYADGFAAVFLEFRSGGGMWLFLPDEDTSIETLIESGQITNFLMAQQAGEWTDAKSVEIHLSMPKFDVSSSIRLTDGLQQMGITDVFEAGRADFSPLLEDKDVPINLSTAKHAARVKVDEEGCEAAAYTVYAATGAALPDEEVNFILDRPFVFAVTSAQSELPLFIGTVYNPAAE